MRKLIVIGIACLGFTACSQKKPAPPEFRFPVKITSAIEQDTPIFLEGLGHVESITSIEIRSRIEGELTGVYFEQGKEVKKDDLLFTIDPKPYEASLKQAQATLEQSLANLAIAEEKVKRYKTLARDEYYSQLDYETLQADYAANLATVQQNQASVDSAAINLDYCWIYAPINGLTGILQVDYGNLVSADSQQALVTLNQMSPIFVTFTLPEFQLPQVQQWKRKSCEPLKVLAAYEDFRKDELFVGKLYMIDNTVDTNTGLIKLRAMFENDKRDLWPGQFIRTRLQLYTQEKAVVIPYEAVVITATGALAFVINDQGVAEQRNISLGQRQDQSVIILSGIKVGEHVVTEGQINLYQGAKVIIKGGA